MKFAILFLAMALLFASASTAWKLNLHTTDGKVIRFQRVFGNEVKCHKLPDGPVTITKVYWDPRNYFVRPTTTFMLKQRDNCKGADGISGFGRIGGSKPKTMTPRRPFKVGAFISDDEYGCPCGAQLKYTINCMLTSSAQRFQHHIIRTLLAQPAVCPSTLHSQHQTKILDGEGCPHARKTR
jgi:hypothetical protein